MKKILILITIISLGFIAVACSVDNSRREKEQLKVALILTGAINDKGWNQKGYEGLIAIGAKYNAEIAYSENAQTTQYNQIIRTYAKNGFNVIIAHGIQLACAVKEVAKEYPDIKFIVISSDRTARVGNGSNVAGVLADGVEQGFLMGVTAAYIAQEQGSKKVAAVGGIEIPAIKTIIDGAKTGVAYVDKNIEILSTYTGSFDDVSKLKEQSITFIQQGATVVMSTANAATIGSFEATKNKGGKSIGANSFSLFGAYFNNLSASSDIDISRALLLIFNAINKGSFTGIDYIYGVKEGVVSISFSTTEATVQKVKSKIEDIKAKISKNEINIQKLYEVQKIYACK